MKQALVALLFFSIASLSTACFGSLLAITLAGEIPVDNDATLTLSASSAIEGPDTSGAYPVYTIPRASLPLTVSVASAATGYTWVFDGAELNAYGSSVSLDDTALSARKHILTLFFLNGTGPKRSATIIIDAID